jgi:hypothetical protein
MARINYAGENMDASPAKVTPVLKEITEQGRVVYGMKVLGNGKLRGDVRRAIEYVLQLGSVPVLTIGLTNQAQLVESVEAVAQLAPKYPFKALGDCV